MLGGSFGDGAQSSLNSVAFFGGLMTPPVGGRNQPGEMRATSNMPLGYRDRWWWAPPDTQRPDLVM